MSNLLLHAPPFNRRPPNQCRFRPRCGPNFNRAFRLRKKAPNANKTHAEKNLSRPGLAFEIAKFLCTCVCTWSVACVFAILVGMQETTFHMCFNFIIRFQNIGSCSKARRCDTRQWKYCTAGFSDRFFESGFSCVGFFMLKNRRM